MAKHRVSNNEDKKNKSKDNVIEIYGKAVSYTHLRAHET